MALSYGDFSGHLKKQVAQVLPVSLPAAPDTRPEDIELPGITKGWRRRAGDPRAAKQPQVQSPLESNSSIEIRHRASIYVAHIEVYA